MSAVAVVGAVSTGISLANSLGLGSVDPVKEAERIATIDTLKRDAIRLGTKTSRPYIQLACWAGATMGGTDYNQALAYSMVQQGQECRVGSDSALAYAKIAKASVDAALLVGGIAGPVATDIAIDHIQNQIRNNIPMILLVVVLIVGVVYVARKGR
jgi:hypothetical protein